MLDRKYVRAEPETVREAIRVKQVDVDLDAVLRLDQQALALEREVQELQTARNTTSRAVRDAANHEERQRLIERARSAGSDLEQRQSELNTTLQALQDLLLRLPNTPDPRAPIGDAEANRVVREWGKPLQREHIKDHIEITADREWADFERARKIGGSRAYILRGNLVLLERALHEYALSVLVKEGFEPVRVPPLVREESLVGTGMFPDHREETYYSEKDNIYLAGTAEVAIANFYRDEILSEDQLPIAFAGISPCFRREAGSAGRDVRGLLRVHHFEKIEQFVLCEPDPRVSAEWHERMLGIAEGIVQAFELPYQVVECATADMGLGKYRMNDIEVWMPSLGRYRETHSCSNLHDWQCRRANVRYRDSSGRVRFPHSLNNTAIATPRILAALVEVHHAGRGTLYVPEALRPFLAGVGAL